MVSKLLRRLYVQITEHKPIDWVERSYLHSCAHYGEILPGRQQRLKRRIKRRLKVEDYACKLPRFDLYGKVKLPLLIEHHPLRCEFKGMRIRQLVNGIVEVRECYRIRLRTERIPLSDVQVWR